MPGLDMQFWGKRALEKLGGKVGNPICSDYLTAWKS